MSMKYCDFNYSKKLVFEIWMMKDKAAPIYSGKQDFYLESLVELARQIRQNTSGIVILSTGALSGGIWSSFPWVKL